MIMRDLGDDEAHFRFIVPRWSYAPLSGAGAALKGGRFNRRGLEALYLSTTLNTAAAEYQQLATLLNPGVLVTFLVSRIRVVDFSQGYSAGTWEPIWSDANCNWRKISMEEHSEPTSWILGDMVVEAGATGLLFPSATVPGGTNLVIYQPSELSRDHLRVHDPAGDLPKSNISWEQF